MDYKKLYLTLFNACTDAIHQLEHHNYGNAETILIEAQQTTEQQYIEESDDD